MSYRSAVSSAIAAASLAISLVSLAGASPVDAPRSHDSSTDRVAGAELYLERRGAARACPDAQVVARSVARVVRKTVEGRVELRVVLEHEGGNYTATMLVSGAREGARSLQVAGPECSGLADALVVTIALLLDPDAKVEALQATPGDAESSANDGPTARSVPGANPPQTPPPQSDGAGGQRVPNSANRAPGPPEDPTRVDVSARAATTPTDLDASFSLGPTLIAGLLPKAAPGANGLLRVSWRAFGAELGGTWTATQTLPFEQGAVRNQARAGHLGLCWFNPLGAGGLESGWSAGGCATAGLARLEVAGRRYAVNREASELLWLTGLGGRLLGPLAGPIGWEFRADGLLPLGERSFSVDNVGPAWNTSSLLGAVSLAVQASLP